MDINKMRLGLMYIFKERSSISKQAKLQLINFIEEADEYQLKTLALDGEFIPGDSLDESAKEILDSRFELETKVTESLKKASIVALEDVLKKAVIEGVFDKASRIKRLEKSIADIKVRIKHLEYMGKIGCKMQYPPISANKEFLSCKKRTMINLAGRNLRLKQYEKRLQKLKAKK